MAADMERERERGREREGGEEIEMMILPRTN